MQPLQYTAPKAIDSLINKGIFCCSRNTIIQLFRNIKAVIKR